MNTHYDVLGVAVDATQEQIKAAYRRQVKITHPDANGEVDSALFRMVQAAGETLSEPDRRAEYDARLAAQSSGMGVSSTTSEPRERSPRSSAAATARRHAGTTQPAADESVPPAEPVSSWLAVLSLLGVILCYVTLLLGVVLYDSGLPGFLYGYEVGEEMPSGYDYDPGTMTSFDWILWAIVSVIAGVLFRFIAGWIGALTGLGYAAAVPLSLVGVALVVSMDTVATWSWWAVPLVGVISIVVVTTVSLLFVAVSRRRGNAAA